MPKGVDLFGTSKRNIRYRSFVDSKHPRVASFRQEIQYRMVTNGNWRELLYENVDTNHQFRCVSKRKFDTDAAARHYIFTSRQPDLHSYRCKGCGKYHVGHIPVAVAYAYELRKRIP